MSKQATKALIDANITENGTQAITGPILNNVLNTMVDDYGTQEELSQLAQQVDNLFGEISGDADLLVSDEDGNVLAEFGGGEIKTKNFNSAKSPFSEEIADTDDSLYICDENKNIVAEFSDGGVKTKNFDSRAFTGGLSKKYFGKRICLYQNAYDYKKRTISPASVGTKQGLVIYDGKAFRLKDTGICEVIDLSTNTIISTFNLASHDALNHANVANFGATLIQDSSFPALYVSIGRVGESNAMKCAVEKINLSNGVYSSTLIQTITLDTSGFSEAGYIAPWSVPAYLIDKERRFLWTFSAKMRTTPAVTGDFKNNVYVAHRFNIPNLSESEVTLTADDVLQECRFEFDVYITQGGTMQDGKIYYCFGFERSTETKPDLRVYDTDTDGIYARIPILEIISEEPEDVAIYDGKMFINTESANIYELTF